MHQRCIRVAKVDITETSQMPVGHRSHLQGVGRGQVGLPRPRRHRRLAGDLHPSL